MSPRLTPISRCAELAGLAAHEIVLGVSPGKKHARMLAGYRRARSQALTRAHIVADMRAAMRKGAAGRAADLLIVLRQLLAEEGAPLPVGGACARRRLAFNRLPGTPTLAPAPTRGVEAQVITWRGSCDNRSESVV